LTESVPCLPKVESDGESGESRENGAERKEEEEAAVPDCRWVRARVGASGLREAVVLRWTESSGGGPPAD